MRAIVVERVIAELLQLVQPIELKRFAHPHRLAAGADGRTDGDRRLVLGQQVRRVDRDVADRGIDTQIGRVDLRNRQLKRIVKVIHRVQDLGPAAVHGGMIQRRVHQRIDPDIRAQLHQPAVVGIDQQAGAPQEQLGTVLRQLDLLWAAGLCRQTVGYVERDLAAPVEVVDRQHGAIGQGIARVVTEHLGAIAGDPRLGDTVVGLSRRPDQVQIGAIAIDTEQEIARAVLAGGEDQMRAVGRHAQVEPLQGAHRDVAGAQARHRGHLALAGDQLRSTSRHGRHPVQARRVRRVVDREAGLVLEEHGRAVGRDP